MRRKRPLSLGPWQREDPSKQKQTEIKKRHRHHLTSEKNIKRYLFTSVGTIFDKKLIVVSPVGSLPIISAKRFLLYLSVCQGNTDGKNMISIDLPMTISPVAKNTTKYLIGLYDMDRVFNNNLNLQQLCIPRFLGIGKRSVLRLL